MKNKKILILIVVLILIVLLGVFVIYPKFIKNNSNNKIKEISLDDDRVASLIKKIEFNNVILADIYKNGDFDRNTIPNDLILKMGLPSWDPDIGTFENNYMYWILSEELIEQNIRNLFGNIKYVHGDLNNNIVCTSREDSNVEYSDFGMCLSALHTENKQYKIQVREYGFGYGYSGIYINQIPYKAEYVNDNKKMSIYVKTFYSENVCQVGDSMRVYKAYDFNNSTINKNDYMFMQGVNEYTMECLKDIDITGLETYDEYISEIEPEKLKDYDFFDKLDSYVYTFELSDDGNYYLSSFKKLVK